MKVVADSRYHALIVGSSALLIARPERFAKTAVGWILRELWKQDARAVTAFVDRHLQHFSIEALKNALKYSPHDQQSSSSVSSDPTSASELEQERLGVSSRYRA